jgi:hypothetical protein
VLCYVWTLSILVYWMDGRLFHLFIHHYIYYYCLFNTG